jgi:hypothetical protein
MEAWAYSVAGVLILFVGFGVAVNLFHQFMDEL